MKYSFICTTLRRLLSFSPGCWFETCSNYSFDHQAIELNRTKHPLHLSRLLNPIKFKWLSKNFRVVFIQLTYWNLKNLEESLMNLPRISIELLVKLAFVLPRLVLLLATGLKFSLKVGRVKLGITSRAVIQSLIIIQQCVVFCKSPVARKKRSCCYHANIEWALMTPCLYFRFSDLAFPPLYMYIYIYIRCVNFVFSFFWSL